MGKHVTDGTFLRLFKQSIALVSHRYQLSFGSRNIVTNSFCQNSEPLHGRDNIFSHSRGYALNRYSAHRFHLKQIIAKRLYPLNDRRDTRPVWWRGGTGRMA